MNEYIIHWCTEMSSTCIYSSTMSSKSNLVAKKLWPHYRWMLERWVSPR